MTRIPRSLAAAGVTIAALPDEAWAQASQDSERYGWGPGMMGWGGGWPGMIFGPIFMILALAIVIAVAVLLVRWIEGPGRAAVPHQPLSTSPTPLDILKERFARGEIDKDEFEERRRILGE